MEKFILKIFIFLLLIYGHHASSQEIPLHESFSIEEIIEQIAESSDEELDYTTLYDDLHFFINNPLNLNTSTFEELEKLQLLTEFQIRSILHYRDRYGPFLTIYELPYVDGFNYDLVAMVIPFLTVTKTPEKDKLILRNAFKYGGNQVFLRTTRVLEKREGFTRDDSSGYLGDPLKLYAKYKYQYKNRLYWGMTMEKDPGEEFLRGSQKNGFDYYSAHFLYKGNGLVKRLALGDYILRFGQGLTMWSGMGTGKSSYVLNTRKRRQGIHKYASTDENRFQRGIATTLNYKGLDLTLFFSSLMKDANLEPCDSVDCRDNLVTSLPTSGYHRTYNELEDKDKIRENLTGANASFSIDKLKTGITYVYQKFDKNLEKDYSMSEQFDFSGDQNSNISFDYQLNVWDIYFFGEASRSQNNGYAFIHGAFISLAPQMQLTAVYRDFQKDYYSYYGDAFSEGSGVQNEKGIYLGTEIYPVKNWKISAYYDNYRFPWLRYNVDAPSFGNDYLLQVDFTPSRYFTMYWRYKDEARQITLKQEDYNIEKLEMTILRKIRYHLNYAVSENLVLKSRIELSFFEEDKEKEKGYLIYQDLQYKTIGIPLVFNFRFGVFDTESYDTRIYAYESDILYAFSIPAYYSKGIRTYLTVKYSIFKNLDIWLRYSQTNYSDKNEIGSGLGLINGNTRSDFKAQLRYKF